MGMARARLGRNVPLHKSHSDAAQLLVPDPRLISRRLLTHETFQPATILNVHAAAWIQFQNHDWFSHGDPEREEDRALQRGVEPGQRIRIELADDDP